jgi:hypothetical protein
LPTTDFEMVFVLFPLCSWKEVSMPHRVFARDVQSSRACSSYVAASFRRLDRADDWRGSITARMVRSVCSAAAARSSRGPTALVLTALVLRHGKTGRQ